MKPLLALFVTLLSTNILVAGLPLQKDGTHLSVTLCELSLLKSDERSPSFQGQNYSINFIFLISKKTPSDGQLALKEITDFKIGGINYQELSFGKTECSTTVNDLDDYCEKWAAWDIPKPLGKALILSTTITGTAAIDLNAIEVSTSVSWNSPTNNPSPQTWSEELEVFTFKTD